MEQKRLEQKPVALARTAWAAWRDERLPQPAAAKARRAAVVNASAAAVRPASLRPALHPPSARMLLPSPSLFPRLAPDVFPAVSPDVFPDFFPPQGRMRSLMFVARARSSLFQSWQAMRLPVRLPRLDWMFGDRQQIPQARDEVRR